jgi:hypothetical protein
MSTPIKSYCNKCAGETNHSILYEKVDEGSEDFPNDGYSIEWGNTHRMIQCCGCDSISMRKDSWFSEDTDEQGRPNVGITYFPPRVYKRKPAWLDHFGLFVGPDEIEDLLKEVYICLQNACPRSAAMSCRALLEHIFIAQNGQDLGSFAKNMDEFQRLGKMSPVQKQAITDALEAGHASTHRGFKPTHEEMTTIVSIIENLIEVLYVHQKELSNLKKRIPTRVKSTGPEPTKQSQ